MTAPWLKQQERSNPFTLRLIAWIALRLGRVVARSLLHPIALYFVLFSRTARRASLQYLRLVKGSTHGLLDVYRHYFCFASTILDRVYLLAGRGELFEFRVYGSELVHRFTDNGRGCILLGAHLGSVEVLRFLGQHRRELPIRMLMYENNAQMMKNVLQAINPKLAEQIIPIGAPDALLQVKESLERGEVVGILGDRYVEQERTDTITFLGKEARFPTGAIRISGMLGAPVILFFGIYRGRNVYEIYFETLTDDPVSSGRDTGWAHGLLERYVRRLEHYCSLAPYNWFNFYDFWSPDVVGAVPSKS